MVRRFLSLRHFATTTTSATVLLFCCFFFCDQAVGSIITDVIDIKTVCAPDSMLCAHGGRAFRDRDHNCEFTPCEFVDPPSVEPTPAPGSQRMANVATWFRNEEFFVPRVRFRDLKRGKKISDRVTKALHAKSQRAIKWSATGAGGGVDTVDIIAVPSRFTMIEHQQHEDEESKKSRTEAHNELLEEALSTGGDLDLAQTGKLLVASRKPWTRFAFFGWLAQHPTATNVMKMLRVIQDANSLDTLIKQQQQSGSRRGVFAVAAESLPKQIVAIPPFVLMNARMGASDRSDTGDDGEGRKEKWFAKQPEAVLVQVFEFLERRLLQMGHLEPSRPANSVESRGVVTLNASTLKSNSSAIGDANTRIESATSVNRSVQFARRYKSTSASLRAFLTPFASLVGDGDEDGAKEAAGAYSKNHVSVWNFTMVLCDAFEKMLQEQQQHSRVPLTELVKRGSATSTTLEHSNSFDGDESSRSTGSSNATIATLDGSFVFSCWLYQQIEDGRGLPVASALPTMQAVRYFRF